MKNLPRESGKTPSGLLRWISLVFTGIAAVAAAGFYATTVSSQEISPQPASEEEIQENIKDRLEKALEENDPQAVLKRAWVGALESIANMTLTIETREGPKLASVSAETSFLRLPSRNAIDEDDLEIGAHTIVMGTLNGNQVLNALRIVVYENPPESPAREVFFARIVAFDIDEDSLEVERTDGQSQTLEISQDTDLTIKEAGQLEEAESEQIQEGSNAILITQTDEEEKTTTLLRLLLLQKPQEGTSEEVREATDAAQNEQ